MAEGVRGADIKVARACFDLLLRHATPDAANLIQTGLTSSDIVTGLRAAGAIAGLDDAEREGLYRSALLSRFGPVRMIGLRGLLHDTASASRLEAAIDMLLDTQGSVRAVAVEWLAARKVDASDHYRQVLASPASSARQLRTSLAGLCTLRQAGDAHLVSTFATHPVTAVRTAAYAAWLKLAASDKDLIALQALGDQGERVKKLAMEMVERHGAFIAFAAACALLNGPQDWPRLMRLGGNGRWDEIEAVARMAPVANAQMKAKLLTALETWLACPVGFSRPTAAQATFLRSQEAAVSLAALAGRNVQEDIERELALALTRRR